MGRQARRLRFLAVFAISISSVLATGVVTAAPAEALVRPSITALSGFVMDRDTGETLYAKSADTERLTGSTTKIMTAKVVLSQPNLDLDATVTVKQAYSDYVVSHGASTAHLVVGDEVTVRQLLYGMMLPSGCDAAFALADTFGTGSTRAARVKSFLAKMNGTAKRLGMTNSHFDSFDGIGQGSNYSTARDLTKLAASAMKNATFRAIVKTRWYTATTTTRQGGTRTMDAWRNTNTLLGWNGTLGIKTGSGRSAKYCMVFAAKMNGKSVLGAVLTSSTAAGREADVKKLITYGYAEID